MSETKIPVVFLIDTEPDGFFIDPAKRLPWAGFERAVDYFEKVRSRIHERTGSPARFSWSVRMDPQIEHTYGRADWVATQYENKFRLLRERGDVFGVHVHLYHWDLARNGWVIDQGDKEWVANCVRTGVESIRASLGECAFFRFGDRWMSQEAMDQIDALGVRCDISMEPGTFAVGSYHPKKPYTGSIPDQTMLPRFPYRPAQGDFRRADPSRADGVWEVPLTTARVRGLIKFWRKTPPMAANLWQSASFVGRVLRSALREPRTHLAMIVRSDVLLRKDADVHMDTMLDHLLKHPFARRFVFTSPEETVRMCREKHG